MKAGLALLAWLGWTGWVVAQSDSLPALPPGPIPANPEFASWKTTIVTPATTGHPEATTKTVLTVRTRGIRDIEAKDEGGATSRWCLGDVQIYRGPGDVAPFVYTAPDRSRPDSYLVLGPTLCPELSWITAEDYVRVAPRAGHRCFVFTRTILDGDATVAETAYLDRTTLLPVYYIDGKTTWTYEFRPAPKAMLVPPPMVEESYQNYLRRKKNLEYAPVPA